jgi:hypothetical protein
MLMSSDVNVRQAEKLGVQQPSLPQASIFRPACVCALIRARARFEAFLLATCILVPLPIL